MNSKQAAGINPAHDLAAEKQATAGLLQLLKDEQAALVDADVERLSALTEEKSKLAARMSELAKLRHGLLVKVGFEATESGMRAWLNSPNASAADNQAWNDLMALVQDAGELNRVNGLLIGQHMARNQASLNILQGNAQGSAIYGPNGQSANSVGRRRLGIG